MKKLALKLQPIVTAILLASAPHLVQAQTITAGHGTATFERPDTSVEPTAPAPGDIIIYTITVDASGGFLSGIDINNPVPANTTFVSGSTTVTDARDVYIYRHEFQDDGNPAAGAGSDGNQDWSVTAWEELGETGGWAGGDIRMGTDDDFGGNLNLDASDAETGGATIGWFRIRDNQGTIVGESSEGGARLVDLEGASGDCQAATLTFDYANHNNSPADSGEFLRIQNSDNGDPATTTGWTLLGSIEGDGVGASDSAFTPYSVDLTEIGAQTRLLFHSVVDNTAQNDGWYIDNVQVTAPCDALTAFTGGDAPSLLSSTFYDGTTYGLADTETMTVSFRVRVDEGTADTTAISNTMTAFFTDLTTANTIAGTEDQTSDADTDTSVTVTLRDDMGDAPESSGYTTLIANDGPQHVVVAGVHLGDTAPDTDSGGFANGVDAASDATDDDAGGDEGVAQLLTSGTSFPSLTSTSPSYSLDVDYTSTAGTSTLYGWIDFDRDGLFEESERAEVTGLTSSGTTTLNWASTPSQLTDGITYARFRISTDTMDGGVDSDGVDDDAALGFASNGEVEDYSINISVGSPYATSSSFLTNASCPSSQCTADLIIDGNTDGNFTNGSVAHTDPANPNSWIQIDLGSSQSIDGITIFNRTNCCENRLSNMYVLVSDTDFTSAGASGEDVTSLTSAQGTATFQFQFGEIANDDQDPKFVSINTTGRYIRLQKSGTNTGGNAINLAEIVLGSDFDFGDAPATFGDANHETSASLFLGSAQPDTEFETQLGGDAGAGADGDDGDGTDDEDSITIVPLNTAATTYSLSVDVSNSGATATLYGWIDLDVDNTFDENERTSVSVPNGTTNVSLDWSLITPSVGTAHIRLRLTTDDLTSGESSDTTDQDDVSIGSATDGEVEDYELIITDASQVFFEAECGITGTEWRTNIDTNASELVYIDNGDNDTGDIDNNTLLPAQVVQYQILVPIAGTYDIYVRGLDFSGGDSFYLSRDNFNWTTFNNLAAGPDYEWNFLQGVSVSGEAYAPVVTTGANEVVTIYISHREDEYRIDKFALLPDESPVPTGLGDTVGSCFDFGDAPDTTLDSTGAGDYITLFGNATTGPIHLVDQSPSVYLGSVAPDTENDAFQNTDATGDDASDEGEAQLISTAGGDTFPTLATSDTSYSYEVDVTNSKDVNATIVAWIDFDRDGVFEAGEQADTDPTVLGSSGSTQATLTWSGLSGLTSGDTVMRLRVSTDAELTTKESTDIVIDGEVEDHQITIYELDYGDAPVATAGNYDDTDGSGTVDGSDDPARHGIVSGVNLGTDPDADTGVWGDGNDDLTNATDDDTPGDPAGGTDDEDGIAVFPAISIVDPSYSLTATVNNGDSSNTASVFAWIDFDQDGSFEESERATLSAGTITPTGLTIPATSSGTIDLDWSSLPGIISGTTYMRVRITNDTSLVAGSDGGADEAATGFAVSGEVEDYEITITQPPSDSSDGPATYSSVIHLQSTDITLGSAIDFETVTFTSADADGDDNDTTDDEDGVTQFLNIPVEAQFFNVEVACNDHDGSFDLGATVYGWIDFDGDDSLGNDANEFTSTACTDADNVSDGSATLTFSGFNGLFAGGDDQVLARFRITTDALTSTDAGTNASDGEVEDYIAQIIDSENLGSCPVQGFLFQNDPSQLIGVDIVTGTDSILQSSFNYEDGTAVNTSTNAWGFNEIDGYAYGYVPIDGTVVRLDTNGGTQSLTRFGPFPELPAGVNSLVNGDIQNGLLYLMANGGDTIYSVNVDPNSPGYMTFNGQQLRPGSESLGADSAFSPLPAFNNLAFGVEHEGVTNNLYHIDVTTGVYTQLADISSEVVDSVYGAAYFDAAGFLYVSANSGGNIYRIDVRDVAAIQAADGTAAISDFVQLMANASGSSLNDGARCVSAPVLIDFGDAPTAAQSGFAADYPTLLADDGARHDISETNTLFLGSVAGDDEINGQPTVDADGDDATDTDDEDTVFSGLISNTTPNATITSSGAGVVSTWIDFNQDGDWDDTNEQVMTDEAVVVGPNVIAISVPAGAGLGTSYARVRLSTDTGLLPTGAASDGEVEDFQVDLNPSDFGDAPAPYDDTASHGISGESIFLGSAIPDSDTGFWGDGTDDNEDATDDDTPGDPVGGVDDENGVSSFPVLSAADTTYTASLALRNEHATDSAFVYAWIDFDQNGTFDEDERATLSAGTITPDSEGDSTNLGVPTAAVTGTVDLDWGSLPGIVTGTTYARVRITTDDLDALNDGSAEDDASIGAATDGEIEDYQITVVEAVDYGDAPVNALNDYDDTDGDGDVDGDDDPARHNIVAGILLGLAIDADSLTWNDGIDSNGNATDDDTEGSAPDDDDGIAGSITLPVDQSSNYDITVSPDNTSGGAVANIYAWIDFDQSGTFDEDERTSTTQGDGETDDETLTWSTFPGLVLGQTYMRVRMTTDDLTSGESSDGSSEDDVSTGLASDGEVEDYQVSVTGMDFGDVPIVANGDYDDTNSDGVVSAADDAAEHAIDLDIYLGDTAPDSEAAGQNTNGDATDDETNGTADEGATQLLTSGSTFPTLLPTDTSYSLTIDLTNTTGTTANVYGWIDFDDDQEFDEDERATTTAGSGATSATLSWSNIGGSGPDIVNGTTFARFRITTDDLDSTTESTGVEDDASLSLLGAASNGEVEDYQIAIGNFDFGDAPDSGIGQGAGDYRTLSVDSGPSHSIDPDIYLGSTAPDLDSDGFEEGTDDSGGNATDDDSNGGDEGLAQLLTSGSSFDALATGDANYSIEVDMNNNSGGPVNLIAWIDFDQSGTFDEDEVALNTLLGDIASTTLNWASIPNDVTNGTTYARFRITSNPQTGNDGSGEDERSYGSFSNGEVEDYEISISGTDFGDAPSSYGTFDSGGGPKHGIETGLYLGDTAPDGEGDGFGDGNDDNGDATDDDSEGTADEGEAQLLNAATHVGDVFPVYNISDGTYSLTLDAFNVTAGPSNATVLGWIDWDIDGNFDEDERAETTVSTFGTTATLSWDIGGAGEPDQIVGNTYARFRITQDVVGAGGSSDSQDSLSLNAYTDGEVEDYAFTITGDVNISGNIFEDINFGGGNGRNRTSALADGGSNFGAGVTVELWDFDGSSCTAVSSNLTGSNPVTTDGLGQYSFTGVDSPATYCVRVVTTDLASTRTSTGAGNTEIAVQTFRSQSTDGNGTVAQIVSEIGGRSPQDVDSAASTFDATTGDGTATHTWSQVITGASDINDLDFGYNFNTVVNTNDSGQGSLRQFMLNAEELSNTGLAQQTQTAGVDVSIFAIPTTDTGYNATGQGEFTIGLLSALPTITQESIYLDGSTQTGTSCPTPLIEVTENGSGATDGFAIETGASLVRGFIINGFTSGAAIDLDTAGSNEVSCNYLGLNASGNAAGNGGNLNAVDVTATSPNNTIGGTVATDANVIAGNSSDGLSLYSDSNTVNTNIIGLAADGLSALGNGDAGILINSAGNQIGSTSAGDANTIASNAGAGIEILANASNTANAIYINSIYNNGDTSGAASNRTLGIDLGNDGITANDGATDPDTGANTLINFPVLGVITDAGSDSMDIPLTLALPDGTYRVEFYANAVCNALDSGSADGAAPNGEGQDFVGSQDVIITSGVQDITTVNLSTLGLVGNQMTAKVIDSSGNTSEFSVCEEIPDGLVSAATISGTVFEDVNYGGGAGRDSTNGVGVQSTVELWASDGNNCTGGSPLQAVTSDPTTGDYTFNTVSDTLFCVRVVNSTVQSSRTGWNTSLIPVQTYRSEATDATQEVGGASPRDADSAAGVYDAITGDGTATQSFSIIDVSGGNVADVDFGFNFSTVVNANSSGQGSLAQFVNNANTLDAADKSGLNQDGLTAGRETSIFMVSNGAALAGLPSTYPNLLSGNSVAEIELISDLVITADDIILDGVTQTNNVGGNAATLGTGGTVGTQTSPSLTLSTLNGPEVQLEEGGIDIQASDVEIRGFAMLPTTTAITISGAESGHIIEGNVIGASAISFSDPGFGNADDLISISTATGNGIAGSPGTLGLIQNNLIGFGSGDGIALSSNATGWTITNNELQGFDGSGNAAISLGAGVNNTNVRGNLMESSTYGIELNNSSGSNAADSIDENSILNNLSGGILIPATATSDGANDITQNIVSGNNGPGIIVLTSQTNVISQNSIFNNDGLGIDLGNDGVTDGVESGSAANEFLNVPVVTMADASDGTNLDISGTYDSTLAATPVTIEIYSSTTCNPNSSGIAEGTDFGEGESFEVSTPATGISGGTFNISVLLTNLGVRRFITAIARDNDGNTSEFSQCEVGLTSDYGDAPNDYFTTEASGGPSHIRNNDLYIGTSAPDIEIDGVPTAAANGDDNADTNDENDIDTVSDFDTLTSAVSTFDLTVDVFNNVGSANLVGWIDFDQSGTFDSDEAATVSVGTSGIGQTPTLSWSSIPVDIMPGSTYLRLRFTTDTSIATGVASTSTPTGPALDGEVEDHQITVIQGYDYGDAPDSGSGYNTADGNSPARHAKSGNFVYLGFVPPDGDTFDFGGDGTDDGYDASCSSDPGTGTALDDDCEGLDDEDAADLRGITPSDTNFTAQAVVTNNTGGGVYVYAWLDTDQDGTFDAGEAEVPTAGNPITTAGASVVTFDWTISSMSVGDTYVRFRVSSTDLTTSGFSGDASDGEVEDYRIIVSELTCDIIYGNYNDNDGTDTHQYTEIRTYEPDSGTPQGAVLADTEDGTPPGGTGVPNVGSVGTGMDPITRRYYFAEWIADTNGGGIQVYYFDGSTISAALATIPDATGSSNDNWNRMAFTNDGLGYVIESADYEIRSFNTTTNTVSGGVTISNAGSILGSGGDIAFDSDDRMYMVTYTNSINTDPDCDTTVEGGGDDCEFYLYEIENYTTTPVANLLLTDFNSTGQSIAGIAFYSDKQLYMQGSGGQTFAWNLGLNDADDGAAPDVSLGSGDLASCIYPDLEPIIDATKTVENITDPADAGFAPGDVLEYTISIRNTGGIATTVTEFIDAIPDNTTYVANSTTIEYKLDSGSSPEAVSDISSSFPYLLSNSLYGTTPDYDNLPVGTNPNEIHSDSQADGIVTVIPSAGSLDNSIEIKFRVTADLSTDYDQICNTDGIIRYDDRSFGVSPVGTNDPTTVAVPTLPATGNVTDDPTCLDKTSGYSIDGTVFEDLNVDQVDDGSGSGENGISGVEIVLRNDTAGTCESTTTDINGDYSFGPLDSGSYTIYEADGVATPIPAACPPITNDPNGYESSTSNTLSVLVASENVTDQDFGDVQGPGFSPNNSNVVLPTNSVFYAHTFAPESEGTVIFSFSESTSPTNNGWSVTLYEDVACDSDFDVGDNVISNAITVTLTSNVPDDICILARVTAPADVSAGDEHIATVTATFTYGDGSAGIVDEVLNVTDTTTTLSSGDGTMVLSKTVENITPTSDFFDNGVPGTSNDAAPGDVLRYVITFQNISTSAISTIDIFDTVPSFTVLSDPSTSGGSDLLLDCRNDPQNDFTDGSGALTCQIANPTGSGLIGHPPGYDGDLQWDLGGSLAPGASGSVSFTVEVE